MTSNSISYMEKIRSWKILSSTAKSRPDYTHDVLLHQPCTSNNNDRVPRLNMPYKLSKNTFISVLEISYH